MNQLLVSILLCVVICGANPQQPIQVQIYGKGETGESLLYNNITTQAYASGETGRFYAFLQFPLEKSRNYRFTKIQISNYGTNWLSIHKRGGLCSSKIIDVFAYYTGPPPKVNLHYKVWGKYVGPGPITECNAIKDDEEYYDDDCQGDECNYLY